MTLGGMLGGSRPHPRAFTIDQLAFQCQHSPHPKRFCLPTEIAVPCVAGQN